MTLWYRQGTVLNKDYPSIVQLGSRPPAKAPVAGAGGGGGRQLGQVESGTFLSGPQYPQFLGIDKCTSAD